MIHPNRETGINQLEDTRIAALIAVVAPFVGVANMRFGQGQLNPAAFFESNSHIPNVE
jgi:hypothetical protein